MSEWADLAHGSNHNANPDNEKEVAHDLLISTYNLQPLRGDTISDLLLQVYTSMIQCDIR